MTPHDFKQRLEQGASMLVEMSVGLGTLISAPYRFHCARLDMRKPRGPEAMRYCLVACVAMSALYYLTVGSVTRIHDAPTFVVAGALLNAAHIAVMALIFSLVGKAVCRSVPGQIQFENALYASVVLPIAAFFAQSLMHLQVKALTADPTLFTSAYAPTLRAEVASNVSASVANWIVFFAYLYMSYLVYVGLRVTGGVRRGKALLAVAPAALLVYAYQSIAVLPVTQQFLRAMTL